MWTHTTGWKSRESECLWVNECVGMAYGGRGHMPAFPYLAMFSGTFDLGGNPFLIWNERFRVWGLIRVRGT